MITSQGYCHIRVPHFLPLVSCAEQLYGQFKNNILKYYYYYSCWKFRLDISYVDTTC